MNQAYCFMKNGKALGRFTVTSVPSFCGGYILSSFSCTRIEEGDVIAFRDLLRVPDMRSYKNGYYFATVSLVTYEAKDEHGYPFYDDFVLYKVASLPASSHFIFADKDRKYLRGGVYFSPCFLCKKEHGYEESAHDRNPNSGNTVRVYTLRRKLGTPVSTNPFSGLREYDKDHAMKQLGETNDYLDPTSV